MPQYKWFSVVGHFLRLHITNMITASRHSFLPYVIGLQTAIICYDILPLRWQRESGRNIEHAAYKWWCISLYAAIGRTHVTGSVHCAACRVITEWQRRVRYDCGNGMASGAVLGVRHFGTSSRRRAAERIVDVFNNNNNNNTRDNVYGAVIMTQVIARVHPVHLTNGGQRQTPTDLQTKPTIVCCESACKLLYGLHHHRHLLLLSPKADTHFTQFQCVP